MRLESSPPLLLLTLPLLLSNQHAAINQAVLIKTDASAHNRLLQSCKQSLSFGGKFSIVTLLNIAMLYIHATNICLHKHSCFSAKSS